MTASEHTPDDPRQRDRNQVVAPTAHPAIDHTDDGGDFLVPDGESCTSSSFPQTRRWPCPAAGRYCLVYHSDHVIPLPCESRACSPCVATKAAKIGAAIAMSRPTHALTLTGLSRDWPTIRNQVNRVRGSLRRRGVTFEWMWHVEANPAGTGNHLHAWMFGQPLSQALLRQAAGRAGLGTVVYLRPVRAQVGVTGGRLHGAAAMTYGLKSLMQVSDGSGLNPSQIEYFELNGERYCHQSRGFFRDPCGRTLGLRDAVKAAQQAQYGTFRDDYVKIPGAFVAEYLDRRRHRG